MSRIRTATVASLLFLAAGCGGANDGQVSDAVVPTTTAASTPTSAVPSGPPTVLAIVSPATGDDVKGNVVRLDLASSGISIVAADGDTSGLSAHYHVFVDRDPVEPGEVIPVEAGIIHTTDDPVVIPGLHVGPHRIKVVYGDGTHRRLGYSGAATSFTVSGPSVDATTPPNAPAGQPIVITVTAEGLAFPGDTLLFVLVDREPPSAGEPIPDEPGVLQSAEPTITVSDLPPGSHTLWVVAGSADRMPLDPAVMDKVAVTVG